MRETEGPDRAGRPVFGAVLREAIREIRSEILLYGPAVILIILRKTPWIRPAGHPTL